ncbi:hypothetical protein U0C82_03495 [Fulvimarina sp. 2208YS6-2-32]|uniref:Uncharacterized protein n=1 Tax=Fulvimarina uroteuthidis TaxID=3098149 RepID=A0ABU5HYM1_9HYPH|nr:hypothetical protein [Fulvimarina sp. 2208YS6-2-32]MDY8108214.1 hypothetical protein [Fulvimarina sp. 2208YS6-2-32]
MIAMTLFLCLKSEPGECHRENVSFQGTLVQCAMFGQVAALEHMKGRPKWSLRRYRCAPVEMSEA